MSWKNILSVAAGGALGTLARHVLNEIALYNGYPFATLIENLTGSLLIGLITGWFLVRHVKPQLQLALGGSRHLVQTNEEVSSFHLHSAHDVR